MSELPPDLAEQVERLRELPAPNPAARARLSEALTAARAASTTVGRDPAPPALSRRAGALWRRRPVLVAASAAGLVISTIWATLALSPTAGPAASEDTLVPVQFFLVAPGAERVAVVGDFNGWQPDATPLAPESDGVWSTVVPLGPGAFTYSYVVDGAEWRADPSAPRAINDFGRPSSVGFVGRTE